MKRIDIIIYADYGNHKYGFHLFLDMTKKKKLREDVIIFYCYSYDRNKISCFYNIRNIVNADYFFEFAGRKEYYQFLFDLTFEESIGFFDTVKKLNEKIYNIYYSIDLGLLRSIKRSVLISNINFVENE